MPELCAAAFFKHRENPDIGIPLYSYRNSNYLYISETDNYLKILRFIQITEMPDYEIINVEKKISFEIGDYSPVTVSKSSQQFEIFSLEDCIRMEHEIGEGASSLFKSQFGYITGLQQDIQLKTFREISNEYFSDSRYSQNWLKIEIESFESSSKYWIGAEKEVRAKEEKIEELIGARTIHDCLSWLMNSRNVRSSIWFDVWQIAVEIMPHEKLLLAAASNWISEKFSNITPETALRDDSFLTVLMFLTDRNEDLDEIGDILNELLEYNSEILLILLLSRTSYFKLRNMLENIQAWGHIENLEKWAIVKGYIKHDQK